MSTNSTFSPAFAAPAVSASARGKHLMKSRQTYLLLGLALSAAGCNEIPPSAPEIKTVRTTTVEPSAVSDDRRAVGEVKPRGETDLGFRVSGKIIARLVDAGATVSKGQILARIDDQDYRNKLRAAKADLVAAQAGLVEAQAAESRQRYLMASGWTTRSSFDAAVKNLRSSEAKLESAKASVDLAQDQLEYTQLRADFDGVVTTAAAEAGQIVNVGQTIFRMARPADKDAVFAIAEAALGAAAKDRAPLEVTVSLLSNPGVAATGVVREVSPVADSATRTYQVKVTLIDPPEQMRFGSSVAGNVNAPSIPMVVLPGSALFDKAGQPAVWVVDPTSGAVGLKAVVPARYEADRIIISDGLAKGDIVVTAGVNRLRENQKVRIAQGGAQ